MSMRNKPELDNMSASAAISNNTPLLSEDVLNFLSAVPVGSSVLELNGGLGIVSEHLSGTCSTKLCEDGRLFFSYRRKLFPKSSVVEMNISPYALSTNIKIADYVVIHSAEFLEIAKKLAKKFVIVMYDFSFINADVKVKNEKVNIDSVTNDRGVTKDGDNKTSSKVVKSTNNPIYDDELSKSTSHGNINNADIESLFDLE